MERHGSRARAAIGRRGALALLGAGGALAGSLGRARAWSPGAEVIDVTKAPYRAAPSLSDNTAPFQAALNALAALGGGTLYIPPGRYAFTNADGLTYSGGSLTVRGEGQESSILLIQHTGTAFTATTSSVTQSIILRDIGFSPPSNGSAAAGAVALPFPAPQGASAWPSCVIENIDFGVASSGVFKVALYLKNAWRSTVRGCGTHGNGSHGTTFIVVDGFSIDNRVENCSCDQVDFGLAVASAIQGLHVSECVFIANVTSLTTGSSVFVNGSDNVLEIFIHDCEFAAQETALNLYSVNTAFISDTHFGTNDASRPTVVVAGCQAPQFSHCQVSGAAMPNVSATGILITGSSNAVSYDTELNDIVFQNISTGVLLTSAHSTTARELKLFGYGFGTLIGTPQTQGGSVVWSPVVDQSGNNTNELEWVAPDGTTPNHSTDRLIYSQPN